MPVDDEPPATEVGATVSPVSVSPLMVSFADCWLAPIAALTLIVSVVLIALVVTVKVAVVAPAGTETVAGTWASVVLTERATVTPDEPGAWEMFTVPVLELPPKTVVGFSETLLTVNGITISEVFWLVPLNVAVMVTV